MKYTVTLTFNKPAKSKANTTAAIVDSSNKAVDYADILLALNPKMSLLWEDYRHSSLNPGRFTGIIDFATAFENSGLLRLSIEEYTKRLISYFIDLTLLVTNDVKFEL